MNIHGEGVMCNQNESVRVGFSLYLKACEYPLGVSDVYKDFLTHSHMAEFAPT